MHFLTDSTVYWFQSTLLATSSINIFHDLYGSGANYVIKVRVVD